MPAIVITVLGLSLAGPAATCAEVQSKIIALRQETIRVPAEFNSPEIHLGFQEYALGDGKRHFGYVVNGQQQGVWLACSDSNSRQTERTVYRAGTEVGPRQVLWDSQATETLWFRDQNPIASLHFSEVAGQKMYARRFVTDDVDYVVSVNPGGGYQLASRIGNVNVGFQSTSSSLAASGILAFALPDATVPLGSDLSKLSEQLSASPGSGQRFYVQPAVDVTPASYDIYRAPLPGRYRLNVPEFGPSLEVDRAILSRDMLDFPLTVVDEARVPEQRSSAIIPTYALEELASPRAACTSGGKLTVGDNDMLNPLAAAALNLISKPSFENFVNELKTNPTARSLTILRYSAPSYMLATEQELKELARNLGTFGQPPRWLSNRWTSVACRRALLYNGDFNLLQEKFRVGGYDAPLSAEEKVLIASLAQGPYSPEELTYFYALPERGFSDATQAAQINLSSCYGLGECPPMVGLSFEKPLQELSPEKTTKEMYDALKGSQHLGAMDGARWLIDVGKSLQVPTAERVSRIDEYVESIQQVQADYGNFGYSVSFPWSSNSQPHSFFPEGMPIGSLSIYKLPRTPNAPETIAHQHLLRFIATTRRAALMEQPRNVTEEHVSLLTARELVLRTGLPAETVRLRKVLWNRDAYAPQGAALFEFQSDDFFRMQVDSETPSWLRPGAAVGLTLMPVGSWSAAAVQNCPTSSTAPCAALSQMQRSALVQQLTFVARVQEVPNTIGKLNLVFRCGERCRRVPYIPLEPGVEFIERSLLGPVPYASRALLPGSTTQEMTLVPNVLQAFQKWSAVIYPLP